MSGITFETKQREISCYTALMLNFMGYIAPYLCNSKYRPKGGSVVKLHQKLRNMTLIRSATLQPA